MRQEWLVAGRVAVMRVSSGRLAVCHVDSITDWISDWQSSACMADWLAICLREVDWFGWLCVE